MFWNIKGLALRDFILTLLNSHHAVCIQFSSKASSERAESKQGCSLPQRFKCMSISLEVETYNALPAMWLLTSNKYAGMHQSITDMNTVMYRPTARQRPQHVANTIGAVFCVVYAWIVAMQCVLNTFSHMWWHHTTIERSCFLLWCTPNVSKGQ
jgi:hypothetical protein